MKFTNILFALLISLLVFSSCNKKQRAIDNLDAFVEKVDKNVPDYTKEEWEEAVKEYDELVAEIDKYEYSGDDVERIAEIKGRFKVIRAKKSAKDIINGIENVAREVEGTTKGVVKEIFGSDDSQEEEKK